MWDLSATSEKIAQRLLIKYSLKTKFCIIRKPPTVSSLSPNSDLKEDAHAGLS